MLSRKTLILSLLVSITILFTGCDDYLTESFGQNIVMSLPKMPAVVSTNQVIQSVEDLQEQLTAEELASLKTIYITHSLEDPEEGLADETLMSLEDLIRQLDFDKYTLLLGVGYYGNHNDTNVRHSLLQIGAHAYEYVIFMPGMVEQPDSFNYGMIVKKLPVNAKVNFRTVIRNEFILNEDSTE